MKKFTFLFTLLLAATSIFAQAPQAFNYQAVIRDADGNLLENQAVGIKISLLQDSISGPEVYAETHTTTTNQFGQVESGDFAAVDWRAGTYHLQLAADQTGGTNYQEMGTSQLLSVPYALYAEEGSGWEKTANGISFMDGNVGIGITNPSKKLHVYESIGIYGSFSRLSFTNLNLRSYYFEMAPSHDFYLYDPFIEEYRLYFHPNGNVGIGTTSPAYPLSVNGTIRSKKVIVDTGWSDFVFEDDYDLLSLDKLDKFIKKNKHLPEIPSAKEVEANGISLGEMDAKLLQKIEELTLYTIEQQKVIEELVKQNEKMQKQMKKLKRR